MNKINIVFMEGRYKSFYGAQKSMLTLIENIDKNKFNPIVLTTKKGKLYHEIEERKIDIKIIEMDDIANKFGGQIIEYSIIDKFKVAAVILKYNFKIYKWLSENNIDIVYVNDVRSLLYCGIAARLKGCPVLSYIRTIESKNRGKLNEILYYLSLKLSTRIICIADGVRENYTQYQLDKYQDKFITLYTGFNFNSFNKNINIDVIKEKYKLSDDIKIVGFVGSVTSRKGIDILIEAAEKIKENYENVKYILVGSTPEEFKEYERKIKSKISQYNLNSDFLWIGYKDNVEPYYRIMDILVLPSRAEGLPRTVIEGLAMGLPVVATDVGGTSEVITSQYLGDIVSEEDPLELSRAILKYLSNNDLLESERNITQRKKYVEDKFSIKKFVDKFEKIVQEEL